MVFFWGLAFLRGEDLYFGWLEEEAKRGKEDATMLNGFFKGGVEGVEGEAYVILVVGVGLGESGSKGFGLHVNGDLSWGLFEEKVDVVKEGQGRNLPGGIRGAA